MTKRAVSPVRIGLLADEVLKLRGREAEHSIAAPTILEIDGQGHIAKAVWYYADCDVVLEHDGQAFRVHEVKSTGEVVTS